LQVTLPRKSRVTRKKNYLMSSIHDKRDCEQTDTNGTPLRTKADVESSPEQPGRLRINPDDIPAELKDRPQWVLWKAERRQDKQGKWKWTKVPYTVDGGKARADDPSTWTTFDKAYRHYRTHRDEFAGIGYEFAADDPFVGVDLDEAIDPQSGELKAWAKVIVNRLHSYTEVSPSKAGVKIWVKAKKPGKRCRTKYEDGEVEMYDQARFFAVTGRRFPGTPATIKKQSAGVRELYEQLFPTREPDPRPDAKPSQGDETLDLTDEELIRKAKGARNGDKFTSLWGGNDNGHASASEADLALCGLLAFWTGGDRDRIDKLFRQSGRMRQKWERADYRDGTIAKALEGRTEFYRGESADTDADADADLPGGKKSQAAVLVDLALQAQVELFHDRDKDAFARVPVLQHHETYKLRSKPFTLWLRRRFHDTTGKPPGAQALQDALGVLEGKALFDGAERPVHVRIAEHEGNIYLDLCNDAWQVVEITPDGWRVIPDPPVVFRRAKAMLALPVPLTGGTVKALRRFVNVSAPDWPLFLACLIAALRPRGPYPVPSLYGEQGSSKSTIARVFRALVDPNSAPVRVEPRNVQDLAIMANNSWMVALDNVSYLPAWLSDALCRLSTGGGFSARTLYENDEETIFQGLRPSILNGIEEIITRSDLLDRAVLLHCPTIADSRRQTEEAFWADFEARRPRILGALLDAVASGLRNLPSVRLDKQPRMADFAKWAVACEAGLGLEKGSFLKAYTLNRTAANEIALEASVLAGPLRGFLAQCGKGAWTGTAGELLIKLNNQAGEQLIRSREWPKRPNALAGRLRRLVPNLRKVGVVVEFNRANQNRTITVRTST
jgi:hypothetical protein